MTKNSIDIKSVLEEPYVTPESVFDKKRTKTSHFMLNTVFPNNAITLTEYFQNAYIDDAEYTHNIKRPLFVLFKFATNDNKWTTIYQRLRLKAEYVEEYFVGLQDNKNLLMIVFQIPDKYEKDYLAFRRGKYSQFSNEYKKLFKEVVTNEKGVPTKSTVWKVIHKSKELKEELERYFNPPSTKRYGIPFVFDEEDELWGKPSAKFEVYRSKNEKE